MPACPCSMPHPAPPCAPLPCSPYVAARLQTYQEKGRVLLEMLLAKAGIPLKQAQLPFIREQRLAGRGRAGPGWAGLGRAAAVRAVPGMLCI